MYIFSMAKKIRTELEEVLFKLGEITIKNYSRYGMSSNEYKQANEKYNKVERVAIQLDEIMHKTENLEKDIIDAEKEVKRNIDEYIKYVVNESIEAINSNMKEIVEAKIELKNSLDNFQNLVESQIKIERGISRFINEIVKIISE